MKFLKTNKINKFILLYICSFFVNKKAISTDDGVKDIAIGAGSLAVGGLGLSAIGKSKWYRDSIKNKNNLNEKSKSIKKNPTKTKNKSGEKTLNESENLIKKDFNEPDNKIKTIENPIQKELNESTEIEKYQRTRNNKRTPLKKEDLSDELQAEGINAKKYGTIRNEFNQKYNEYINKKVDTRTFNEKESDNYNKIKNKIDDLDAKNVTPNADEINDLSNNMNELDEII